MYSTDLAMQNRCMYNIQRAFLRLQSDLDPLVKPVPTPSSTLNLPSTTSQMQKPSKRRQPNTDDMHATNRIISHVLRKVRHCTMVCMKRATRPRHSASCVTKHVSACVGMHRNPQSCIFNRCCLHIVQAVLPVWLVQIAFGSHISKLL